MAKLTVKSKFFAMKDKVEVDDEEINKAVQPIIEADKDILSKIKITYDEDENETFILFPKSIVPITFFFNNLGDYVFMNYAGMNLKDVEGSIIDGYEIVQILVDDVYCVGLVVEGDETNEEINTLSYIMCSQQIDTTITGDWYKILNPQSGTKLYRHRIACEDDEGTDIVINVISPRESRYIAISELVDEIGQTILSASPTFEYNNYSYNPIQLCIRRSYMSVICINQDNTLLTATLDSLNSDTVTPL